MEQKAEKVKRVKKVKEISTDLKITLVRSTIGAIPKHRKTVQALGLRKMQSSVRQKDNPAIRGMLHQVRHLVKVEDWKE